jgi:hypothetical protein
MPHHFGTKKEYARHFVLKGLSLISVPHPREQKVVYIRTNIIVNISVSGVWTGHAETLSLCGIPSGCSYLECRVAGNRSWRNILRV